MKPSKSMLAWNVIYPIGIYFVITTIVLFVLSAFFPDTADTKLFYQLNTSLAALPFMIAFYRQDEKQREKKIKNTSGGNVQLTLGAFFTGGFFALAWNNVLGMMQLADYSASWQQVTKTFYTGRMLLEITALCIVIPVVEELLYRGIVFGRLKDWLGSRAAVLLSAFIFGCIHMNLVQFVYAAVFGLLLAWMMDLSGSITAAAAAHMAANLTSVLRSETNLFSFMGQSRMAQSLTTILLFAAAAAGIAWMRYVIIHRKPQRSR